MQTKHHRHFPHSDPEVMLITRGTRGDVQPFVALARGLVLNHGCEAGQAWPAWLVRSKPVQVVIFGQTAFKWICVYLLFLIVLLPCSCFSAKGCFCIRESVFDLVFGWGWVGKQTGLFGDIFFLTRDVALARW